MENYKNIGLEPKISALNILLLSSNKNECYNNFYKFRRNRFLKLMQEFSFIGNKVTLVSIYNIVTICLCYAMIILRRIFVKISL